MSEYKITREEFHQLQDENRLDKKRINAVTIIKNGRSIMPPGLNGICIYHRENGSIICEQAFLGGAVDGYARYFNNQGEIVGEDYYIEGGVVETRIFK